MAHMIPVAERFAAYHVETSAGVEIVPEEVCGALPVRVYAEGPCIGKLTLTCQLECRDKLSPYLENDDIRFVQRKEGWYGRLSAPGYLDCTSWDGPHATERDALNAVKETFEVDDDGETNDGQEDDNG